MAVLDWELSTTGQPLADLVYFLMPHYWPSSMNIISTLGSLKGIEGKETTTPNSVRNMGNGSNKWTNCDQTFCAGFPNVADLISIYCRCRGIPSALPDLNFYLALSVFKMAGIAQVCTRLYTPARVSYNSNATWYPLLLDKRTDISIMLRLSLIHTVKLTHTHCFMNINSHWKYYPTEQNSLQRRYNIWSFYNKH